MNQESEQEKYDELAYYTLSHTDSRFIHQHIVDAHAAQRADEGTKPIALTFALAGLYLHLEKGYSGRQVQLAHMHMARRKKAWPAFTLPLHRGAFTASEVMAAPPGQERDTAIEKWCASVWEAYSESHEQVADLVQTELQDFRP